MIKVGITGQPGFIGTHLAKYVTEREDTELVPFEDSYFSDEAKLRAFVKSCDVVVHLAAASRMPSEEELYNLNVGLVQKVIDAMEAEKVTPHVMFSSSTHETRDTAYGRAKLEGRKRFEAWAERNGAAFTGFIFPNIYGPGARVHYASFIANFAWELQHGEEPKVMVDATLPLKHVGNLCKFIGERFGDKNIERIEVPHDFQMKVTDILSLFKMFAVARKNQLELCLSEDNNIKNLFDTYIAYR